MTDAESSSSAATTTNVVIQRSLNIKPFVKQTDANETAFKWQRYKKDIERQFRFFGINDPDTKKDGLLIYGGGVLVDIDEALPDPASQADDDAYKVLIRKLETHFIPKKNKDFARFQMGEMKQQTHETLAEYYAKIRDIARKCDYGTHEEDAIRDHLIRTMSNNKIRSKAIKDNLTLERILIETALDDQTKEQAGAISKKLERNTERIRKVETRRQTFQSNQHRSTCLRCGSSRRHQRGETCPAMGAACENCGKLNHYTCVCLGKPQRQQVQGNNQRRNNRQPQSRQNRERNDVKRDHNQQRQQRQGRTKHIERDDLHNTEQERHSDDNYDSSDDECYMQHLNIHHTSQYNNNGKTCTIQINGLNIQTEPDTGSDANIMDEKQFKKLQQHAPEITPKPLKVKLKALKEDLPLIGEADVTISNQTRTVYINIIVIK